MLVPWRYICAGVVFGNMLGVVFGNVLVLLVYRRAPVVRLVLPRKVLLIARLLRLFNSTMFERLIVMPDAFRYQQLLSGVQRVGAL